MFAPKRFRSSSVHTLTRAIFVLTITLSFFNIWDSRVASAACAINGKVYVDYNSNGKQDVLEPGQVNIKVTGFAPDGTVAATTTTIADGTYSLAVAAAIPQVRIEFGDVAGNPGAIPTYLRSGPYDPTPALGQSDTTVTFVDCTGAAANDVDLGLVSPGEYCHTINPNLGLGCYVSGDQFDVTAAAEPVLVTFPYTSGAPNFTPPYISPSAYDAPAHTQLAVAPEIGTTYGIAYQRSSDSFFVSSYVKRHTGLGPSTTNGNIPTTGGIYRIDQRTTPPTVTTFVDLAPLVGTGADPHDTLAYIVDAGAFDAVGKVGLGDLDISEDDQTLYTVNLNTRTLISINIATKATATVAIPNPNPGCTNGQFRPFGLAVHHDLVYIGMVCDASTGTAADLEAIVEVMNPTTGAFAPAPVLRFALDYPRRCGDNAPGCVANASALWNPWIDTWTFTQAFIVYPEPMLTDIDFDSTGDMILGFRDRWGDQSGANQRSPTPATFPGLYSGITAGDTLRACINAAGTAWTIEQNAKCGTIQTGGNAAPFNVQGPGGGEYYYADNIGAAVNGDLHDEITTGGILQLPGSPDVAVVAFDPVPDTSQTFDGGVIWLSNQAGTRTRSYRVFDSDIGNARFFGKANGLGSLEAACGPAPLEIGNRVWEDLDKNGQQDPGEMPIAGVTVSLYDATGVFIAKTTTNAAGEYIFNAADVFNAGDPRTWFDINNDGIREANEPAGIMPKTTYKVALDDPANFGGGPLSAKQYYATPNNIVVVQRDSDGIVPNFAALVSAANAPSVTLTTGEFGDNNHTYDFGFSVLPTTPTPTPTVTGTPNSGFNSHIGYTLSKSSDTPFAGPGSFVTWTLTISNPNSLPATNIVVTDNVPSQLTIIPPVTTTSSSGTVTVSGNTVTFKQAILNPGDTVRVVIKTQVSSSVSAPFVITNEATGCCDTTGGGTTASAQIISANRLPATGDSWFGQFRLPLLLISLSLGLLLIVRLVERRRMKG